MVIDLAVDLRAVDAEVQHRLFHAADVHLLRNRITATADADLAVLAVDVAEVARLAVGQLVLADGLVQRRRFGAHHHGGQLADAVFGECGTAPADKQHDTEQGQPERRGKSVSHGKAVLCKKCRRCDSSRLVINNHSQL
ncbi:hypothetical protein D3C72_1723480 [compost metagenome]